MNLRLLDDFLNTGFVRMEFNGHVCDVTVWRLCVQRYSPGPHVASVPGPQFRSYGSITAELRTWHLLLVVDKILRHLRRAQPENERGPPEHDALQAAS